MEPRDLPLDPTIPMSSAIADIEKAAARAHQYGRFWMAYGDHAHGRRWFATEGTLREMAGDMRYQQWYMLHPPEVDTPTKDRPNDITMKGLMEVTGVTVDDYHVTIIRK